MRQVILYPDREDGGWVAEVPSLPGCVSQGETKEEALTNIREAIEAWIEAAKGMGREIPVETADVEICLV
jgi:predicted RNase H-like HicB family nuclease